MDKPKTTKNWTSLVYYVFFLFLAAYALYYCLRKIQFQDIIDQLHHTKIGLVWLSVLLGLLASILRALRWRILIEPLGYKPKRFNIFNALMVGNLANLAIPRIGEVTRCAILYKSDKIPVDNLFGTVVIERIIDVVCLGLAIVAAFFLRMDLFTRFITENVGSYNVSPKHFILVGSFILVVCIVLYFYWKNIMSLPLMKKVLKIAKSIWEGIKSIFKLKEYSMFIFYSIAIWVCIWGTSYCIIKALPSTQMLTPVDGLFLMVLGSLAWVLPFPGAMGAFHLIVAAGLTLYGVPTEPDGTIFAVIAHTPQILGTIVVGVISLIFVSLNSKKIK